MKCISIRVTEGPCSLACLQEQGKRKCQGQVLLRPAVLFPLEPECVSFFILPFSNELSSCSRRKDCWPIHSQWKGYFNQRGKKSKTRRNGLQMVCVHLGKKALLLLNRGVRRELLYGTSSSHSRWHFLLFLVLTWEHLRAPLLSQNTFC